MAVVIYFVRDGYSSPRRGHLALAFKEIPPAYGLMAKLTIYYASDIHGSELLWRKFINAGPFYRAKVVIMGGDLTGKGIVPIVRSAMHGGHLHGTQDRDRERAAELGELEDDILFNGMYPYRCTEEEAGAARRLTAAARMSCSSASPPKLSHAG